jgi:hypothetical protein
LPYPGYTINSVRVMAYDPTEAVAKFTLAFSDTVRQEGIEVKGIIEVDDDGEPDPAVLPEPFRPNTHRRPSPLRK